MNHDLLARTLYELQHYPEQALSWEALHPWERDRYGIMADRFVAVMQAHNYAFLKFLPNQGGKLG